MNKQKNLHLKNKVEKANKRLFNLLDFQPDLRIHRFLYHSTYNPSMNFIVFETFKLQGIDVKILIVCSVNFPLLTIKLSKRFNRYCAKVQEYKINSHL